MALTVIALRAGFYDGARRREGEKFTVRDGEKASWFIPVKDEVHTEKSGGTKKTAKAGSDLV